MGGDVPVTVAMAQGSDVPVEIQVIGNVEAYSTITVKAQVGGQLTDVFFHEGDYVKKGDLLFTIDQRPLEAASQPGARQCRARPGGAGPGAGQSGARRGAGEIRRTRRPSATRSSDRKAA